MDKKQRKALIALADVCQRFDLGFTYTNSDDGVHVSVDGKEVFVGFDFSPTNLRDKAFNP